VPLAPDSLDPEATVPEYMLTVNGQTRRVDCGPDTPLIHVLRNNLGLKGTKLGCGLEQCGACAVLVDGEARLTCVTSASNFEDREIVTIEGLARNGTVSRVQQAFIDEAAAQCGYCTPGMIIAITALLDWTPRPTRAQILDALTGHLCRCGSHARILAATQRLVRED